MAATATRGRPTRRPPAAPLAGEIGDVIAAAGETEPDLAPVIAALTRTMQTTLAAIAAMVGRGDISPNATLVRLGAHREDVETLRAFLAAQPRPAHIPPEE